MYVRITVQLSLMGVLQLPCILRNQAISLSFGRSLIWNPKLRVLQARSTRKFNGTVAMESNVLGQGSLRHGPAIMLILGVICRDKMTN